MLSFPLVLLSCRLFWPLAAACIVIQYGSREEIILQGRVISPLRPLQSGYVHVRKGRIARVGERLEPRAHARQATIIDCGDSVITPGFINTHEHIEYSLTDPLPDTGERYGARNEWRWGLNNKARRDPVVVSGTETNATIWGELRHIFSGTTSILGNGYVPGLTRNLDRVHGLGKDLLGASIDIMANFPLDDRSGILRLGDCDYGPNAVVQGATDGLHRYIAHVGEGSTAQANNEFQCLSNRTFDTTPRADGSGISVDILGPNMALIQVNSLTQPDFDLVAHRGAMVVWSPRSNIAMYGNTLNVTYLLEAGITVALGTDWLPTGSATISREAHCAVAAMELLYNTSIKARTLWQMVTRDAAKVAGFEHHIGSLEAGKLADIAVWSRGNKEENTDAYAQALFSPPEALELVMRGGEILLAGSTLRPLGTADLCERVLFGAVEKFVCVKGDLNTSFADFQSFMRDKYPAILPGVPDHEPSCQPVLG